MKKILLFTLVALYSQLSFTQTPVRVLYLATDVVTSATDLFYANILSNPAFSVTKRVTQASFAGNYNDFDVIVLHESITGGEGATVGHETRLLKDVDKPVLNFKTYVYNNTGTARWGWGAPNAGKAGKGIYAKVKTHPVFKDITLDANDSVYIFSTYLAKNSQPTTIAIGGYEIGSTTPAAAGGGTVAIHDLPGSVRLGAGKTSKYLMISIYSGSYGNLTADGIKLIYNALDYLVSGTQYESGTGLQSLKESNIFFDGNIVRNPNQFNLSLIDATGKVLLKTNSEFSMDDYQKGVYVVVPEGNEYKNVKIVK